jgi:hypothetical protein
VCILWELYYQARTRAFNNSMSVENDRQDVQLVPELRTQRMPRLISDLQLCRCCQRTVNSKTGDKFPCPLKLHHNSSPLQFREHHLNQKTSPSIPHHPLFHSISHLRIIMTPFVDRKILAYMHKRSCKSYLPSDTKFGVRLLIIILSSRIVPCIELDIHHYWRSS